MTNSTIDNRIQELQQELDALKTQKSITPETLYTFEYTIELTGTYYKYSITQTEDGFLADVRYLNYGFSDTLFGNSYDYVEDALQALIREASQRHTPNATYCNLLQEMLTALQEAL